jgi:hypothetical protein
MKTSVIKNTNSLQETQLHFESVLVEIIRSKLLSCVSLKIKPINIPDTPLLITMMKEILLFSTTDQLDKISF